MKINYTPPYPASDGEDNTIADKITLIAQYYAGYFIGHPYRFDQQKVYRIVDEGQQGIHVSKKLWKGPTIQRDNCQFCERTTDEEVKRRVAGFQHQIDIEILRNKTRHYNEWLKSNSPDIQDWHVSAINSVDENNNATRELILVGTADSAANRRKFIELFQNKPLVTYTGQQRPDGWAHKPIPLVDLPLRLKRKMVIEWNHIYRDFLTENPDIGYDFNTKTFYKEVPDLEPLECCGGSQFYNTFGDIQKIHQLDCEGLTPIEKLMINLGNNNVWLG